MRETNFAEELADLCGGEPDEYRINMEVTDEDRAGSDRFNLSQHGLTVEFDDLSTEEVEEVEQN